MKASVADTRLLLTLEFPPDEEVRKLRWRGSFEGSKLDLAQLYPPKIFYTHLT